MVAFPPPLVRTNGYTARSSVEKNQMYQSLAASHDDILPPLDCVTLPTSTFGKIDAENLKLFGSFAVIFMQLS